MVPDTLREVVRAVRDVSRDPARFIPDGHPSILFL
jgi:hypothetical protein